MKLLTTILATILLLLLNTYSAKVVRVSNRDTITVSTDYKEQIRIRLEGIDCQESGQSFGFV
jgi:micrococcal nuclease